MGKAIYFFDKENSIKNLGRMIKFRKTFMEDAQIIQGVALSILMNRNIILI